MGGPCRVRAIGRESGLEQGKAKPVVSHEPEAAATGLDRRHLSPLRVLCADDDPTTVALVTTGLHRRGWTVTSAVDAMQAVMFAVRHQPDIILLDIRMPGGDGYQVLRRLKRSARTLAIPVVVVSGSLDERAPARCHRLGADAFISKPLDIDLLEATMEAVLGLGPPPPGVHMDGAPEDEAANDPTDR